MIEHRNVYDTSYRSNFSQAFTPRDEKPWRKFEPINADPPTKQYSRKSNMSHRSNNSDRGHVATLGGSLPGIFHSEPQPGASTYARAGVASSQGMNEVGSKLVMSQNIAAKAAEIEHSIQAERAQKEVRRVIEFYQNRGSPNCAVVLLVARWLRLSINFVDINLQNQNSVEELKKVNPVGQVPVIIDADGFTLSESRAIMKYLTLKYASRHQLESLYPSDPARRAQIDAMMDYEHSSLAPLVRNYISLFLFDRSPDRNHNMAQLQIQINDVLTSLSQFLTVRRFFGNDDVSLADVLLGRNLAMLQTAGFFRQEQNCISNLMNWLERMTSLPNWHECMEAVNGLILSNSNQ